jgi:hypothetical protein
MSRPQVPTAPNGKILTNQAMAGAFVSPVVDSLQADGIAWECVYTGTPTGVFTIETSNQYDAASNPTPTFIAAPAVTPAFPVPAGAGGSFMVTTPGVSEHLGFGRYQRLRWAPSAGAGVLNLWVVGTGSS